MNQLQVIKNSGVETVDSRQIAEAVGKEHSKLIRDIRNYCDYLNEAKIGLVDFFVESNYVDSKGEERPCYNITKKGCEMIANKMTGQKGVVFTALYVNAFHDMQQTIQKQLIKPKSDKSLEIKEMNARVRMSNQFLKLADVDTLSKEYKNILVAKSAEVLTGEKLLPIVKSEQKMYSAGEIGKMLGITAQRVGRLANLHGIKVTTYGEFYRDKSPYSSKEVDAFRYNDKAIQRFEEILGKRH